jgi:uncharacterized membrane protein (UPF0127 family)
LKAWNETRQTTLVEHGHIARTFWSRGRGLLGTKSLPPGDGLLIDRCSSIHSFGMQYRFDALFLNKEGRVVHRVENMKPSRLSRHVFSSRAVLELPAGTIAASGTQHGDVIRWELVSETDPS